MCLNLMIDKMSHVKERDLGGPEQLVSRAVIGNRDEEGYGFGNSCQQLSFGSWLLS